MGIPSANNGHTLCEYWVHPLRILGTPSVANGYTLHDCVREQANLLLPFPDKASWELQFSFSYTLGLLIQNFIVNLRYYSRKVVSQLSEYIRTQHPDIKGYSRSSIYNMVLFYEEYSSKTFIDTVEKYLNSEFVQPLAGQLEMPSVALSEYSFPKNACNNNSTSSATYSQMKVKSYTTPDPPSREFLYHVA